ncbi:MAG: DUF7544 domain-containing protein [Chloroflexia bacterium]
MDYGKILARSWQITWRWKFLWVLGLLAGAAGFQASFSYRFRGEELERLVERLEPSRPAVAAWVIVALAVAVVLMLGLWAFSCIGRGGLIAGIRQIEEEGTTTLQQSWRAGVQRFWTVLGLDLLASLVSFLPMAVACLCLWALVLRGLLLSGPTIRLREGWSALGLGLLCAAPAVCLLVLLMIAVGLIHTWALQASIQEGMGALRAFARGWDVLRSKLGPSLLLWLLLIVIGWIVGLAIGLTALLFLAPGMTFLGVQGAKPVTIVLLVVGALLTVPTALWIGSVTTTFTYSAWTLAYRQLAGLEKQEATVPGEDVPPAVA